MITNNIGRFASDQQFFSQTKTSQGPFLGVLSGATGVGMATVRVTEQTVEEAALGWLEALGYKEEDVVVCGCAENIPQAMKAIKRLKPDIVTVDISLEDASGLELISGERGPPLEKNTN